MPIMPYMIELILNYKSTLIGVKIIPYRELGKQSTPVLHRSWKRGLYGPKLLIHNSILVTIMLMVVIVILVMMIVIIVLVGLIMVVCFINSS